MIKLDSLGLDKIQPLFSKSMLDTINSGFPINEIEVPPEKPEEPIKLNIKELKFKCINKDSVINSIETGFGSENVLIKDPPKPTYKLHLCKENYLGEFRTKEDKERARLNLEVPSLSELKLQLSNYATKDDVEKIIVGTIDLRHYYTKSEIDLLLENSINLDDTPTKGSDNAVTSNGVWLYIDDTVGLIHRYINTI